MPRLSYGNAAAFPAQYLAPVTTDFYTVTNALALLFLYKCCCLYLTRQLFLDTIANGCHSLSSV